MSVIWLKVWSDLWDNKVRTLLAVLSIAAGVFAIGATFGMADQLLAGMDAAHQASVPAHLTIYTTENLDETMAYDLRKIKGVEDIQLGSQVNIRYKIRPGDEWDEGWLVMREDYTDQKYELLPLKAGEWPKGNRIGIERLSSQHFGLELGDTVLFEVNDRPKVRTVSGKLRHNFVPPPDFGGPAVFFTDAQGMELFDIPKGKYNELIVRVTPYSEALARQVASEIKDRLSKERIGVAVTIYQDPIKHWGRFIVLGINLVLQLMAIVSLGASVVLVLNTLMALVTQQISQIGILKAIGATQGKIVQVYLVGVLVYGLLALFIALPLGAVLAYGLTKYLLNLFNIDYEQFQYSLRAWMLQAVAAIAVPLLAALWPILSGTRVTVREALASYGLGSDFGSNWLDRGVEWLGRRFLSGPYAMALGNMFRRKGRLLLTQGVLIMAGTMFLAVMSLSSSLNLTVDNIFAKRQFDILMAFDEDQRLERTVAVAKYQAGVEHVELIFRHGASILKEGQRLKEAGLGAELFGLPNGSDMFRPPLLVGGRWLRPEDDRAIVIRKDTADENDISLGDTITLDLGELGDSKWQVVGFYSDVFSDVGGTDPVYANLEAVSRATKQYHHGDQIFVRTERREPGYVQTVASQLKKTYEAKSIDVAVSQTEPENRQNIDSQFAIVITMFLILAMIMAVVGGIGLMGSLSISVVERTREIGVMRAIGAKTWTILGMFVMEGVLQGLLSWLVVVPLSFALGKPMSNALGQVLFQTTLDYQYDFGAVWLWLGLILIISILASLLPARSATQISVRESLAYG
ncbi:MAG: ABC transporter permease [Anaerolineae bacterium]|nr:ABC transporter permease [Anaerolineae bacterium]